jgi:hypothetical protein
MLMLKTLKLRDVDVFQKALSMARGAIEERRLRKDNLAVQKLACQVFICHNGLIYRTFHVKRKKYESSNFDIASAQSGDPLPSK